MYAMYQITFWRLVYGNQLQKYVSNISIENSKVNKKYSNNIINEKYNNQ